MFGTALFSSPLILGVYASFQAIVYRGHAQTIQYQAGMYSCSSKTVHSFPAYAPGLADMKQSCDKLVREIIGVMHIWNMVCVSLCVCSLLMKSYTVAADCWDSAHVRLAAQLAVVRVQFRR